MAQDISLIIKAAMQSTTDFVIKCSEDWTVMQIKTHICNNYPGNPAVGSQRLIYSGRLLQDSLLVKDFIRKFDDTTHTHILHLVCSSLIGQSSSIQPPVMSTPNLEIPPVQASVNVNSAPINQQFVGADIAAQQLAMYHQLYAQYLALYPNFAFQTQFAAPVSQTQVVSPTVEPPPAEPVEENIDNNNEQQRPDNNIRMNAAAGAADEDDEFGGRRDWLDWFYFLTRALMLLSLLYLYSSLSRFLIFVGIAVIVYLYRNRNMFYNAEQQPDQQGQTQPENPQQQEDEMPTEEHNSQTEEASETDQRSETPDQSGEDEEPAEENEPRNFSNLAQDFLKTVWSIIFSFFMSLIPEPPAAIAQN